MYIMISDVMERLETIKRLLIMSVDTPPSPATVSPLSEANDVKYR